MLNGDVLLIVLRASLPSTAEGTDLSQLFPRRKLINAQIIQGKRQLCCNTQSRDGCHISTSGKDEDQWLTGMRV